VQAAQLGQAHRHHQQRDPGSWATTALCGASHLCPGDALRIIIAVTSGTFAPTSNQALIHALVAFPVAGWG
jgi:hypothetical protein